MTEYKIIFKDNGILWVDNVFTYEVSVLEVIANLYLLNIPLYLILEILPTPPNNL